MTSLRRGNAAAAIRPTRIAERIAIVGKRPITLIIAPAGYGKSVALEQYLGTLSARCARFDVAVDTERFIVWLGEALDRFEGTVAVDSLERASADVVSRILAAIERTKSRIRWILATRSTTGLPIGTWLAYGDCEFAVDAGDLQFTIEELAEMARGCAQSLDHDDLEEILSTTGGWPAGIRIALHAMARTDRRDVQATVREASHRFWSEQVYAATSNDERTLLAFAAALPEIDAGVLERAGCSNALERLETFRARTGLLQERTSGTYRCPQLFLDFLRHQTALRGTEEREAIHLGAARALEAAGNLEAALTSYVTARSNADILRVLETSGFDLLERGRGDATASAIRSLDDATRRTNGRILALRGVLQSLAGNPARAEVLLRRSIFLSQGDRDLAGFATLRLAPLIANQSGDISAILTPLANDQLQSVTYRIEAISLLAASYAIAGDKAAAESALLSIDELLLHIDLDPTRARVLQRIGVARMYLGESEAAKQALIHSGDLAAELHLHSVESRAWSALSNLMCHAYDDVMSQLWYAERAASAATRSGDSLELQTALVQVAAAEMRRGNAEESAALEEQLSGIRSDSGRTYLLPTFKALRLAWDGRFDEAHHELAARWDQMHFDFDRLICGAQCALFLALDGRRKASIDLLTEVASLAETVHSEGLFRVRYVALALLLSVVAEVVNERATCANRLIRKIGSASPDPVILLAARTADEFASPNGGVWLRPEILVALERLTAYGYADVALVLSAVCGALDEKKSRAGVDLTRSELMVLKLLGKGLSTKEIAARDGRSVNTIRAHVANAIGKLRCHGRSQALALARKLEIIP